MIHSIHGGDIYRNQINIDFSVNINPFGLPDTVRTALKEAVELTVNYPDIHAKALTDALAAWTGIPTELLVCGNGASELFTALCHALRPKTTLIPVPSFSGYEKAAKAAGSRIVWYPLLPEHNFLPDEGIFAALTAEIDLLFLANPNNPVGNIVEASFLERIAKHCRKNEITLVLDECFIAFTGEESDSFRSRIFEFPNVILVNAFTKLFAMPGVRLGYFACSDLEKTEKIKGQLPEWNLSIFAQIAGAAACTAHNYIKESTAFVCREREWLKTQLEKLGMFVYPTKSCYLFVRTGLPLYEKLLEQEILVRDCANFRGLGSGYYRIAVKTRAENEQLLRAVKCLAGIPVQQEMEENGKIGSTDKNPVVNSKIEYVLPGDIENRSFEMIAGELTKRHIVLHPAEASVIMRVIHTSADFSYADTMDFSEGAVEIAKELLRNGADIVTDTNMALSGINKKVLAHLGGNAYCFMADEITGKLAKERGTTRAAVSMERGAELKKPILFVIGNAPTALIQLYEMIRNGRYRPAFIIGVPVGFVNVEAAKELIRQTDIPYIVNRGQKGGSNVAAAICNALLYELHRE